MELGSDLSESIFNRRFFSGFSIRSSWQTLTSLENKTLIGTL
jgi:hypothetical protein